MEFSMKTLVVFALLTIATLAIILFMQSWTGNSTNIIGAANNFFADIL